MRRSIFCLLCSIKASYWYLLEGPRQVASNDSVQKVAETLQDIWSERVRVCLTEPLYVQIFTGPPFLCSKNILSDISDKLS